MRDNGKPLSANIPATIEQKACQMWMRARLANADLREVRPALHRIGGMEEAQSYRNIGVLHR